DCGHLDYARTMRLIVPGATLVALGFQTVFVQFFRQHSWHAPKMNLFPLILSMRLSLQLHSRSAKSLTSDENLENDTRHFLGCRFPRSDPSDMGQRRAIDQGFEQGARGPFLRRGSEGSRA